MANQLVVISWRDIPAQVNAQAGRRRHQVVLDDDSDKVIVKHSGGATIEMSATEMCLTIGANKMVMSLTSITFNDGVVKIGPAGVSLAQGAMTMGVPPV